MHRTLLVGLLAAALVFLPSRALGEGDDTEQTVVQIHSASDLAEHLPDLAAVMNRLLPDAEIVSSQPGVLVVKATAGVQRDVDLLLAGLRRDVGADLRAGKDAELAKRAFEWARANADALARLRQKRLKGSVLSCRGSQALLMLTTVSGVSLVASQPASDRLADRDLTLDLEDVSARQVLDMLLRQCGLVLTLDRGSLRIRTAKEAMLAKIVFDFRHVAVPTEDEWEEAAGGATPSEAGEADDLKTLVQALREEVRALRQEVREVRSILEEIRDR
jgi:hypothetical protein